MNLEQLKEAGEAPHWLTQEGLSTLSGGYLIPGETPKAMYWRVAKAAASYYPKTDYSERFFNIMWKNWLCPASPILSNLGTDRGLPISCNTVHVPDSVDGIFNKIHEFAMLSKNGAGVGIYFGDIRGRGAKIKGNGRSEGVIPWARIFDTTVATVNQGGTRKGAAAAYLPIDHIDIEDFLNMRRPTGDPNTRCLNLNHAVCISNQWMEELVAGDTNKRAIWAELLKTRVETGQPYILFTDHVNDQSPECYKTRGLKVKTSNICTEITLFTDELHSFVCCLSSLNAVRFDEWKNTDTVELATRFLDAVLEEYIQKASSIPGLEAAVRSAVKGRAIGIGVLGWHALLQSKMIPFDSFDAMRLNADLFRTIREGTTKATTELALELGEPEWCKGSGRRNTHCEAVAPTVSNAAISGVDSQGIEVIPGVIYAKKSAKGTFLYENRYFKKLLQDKGHDTPEVWKSVNAMGGSVQHLKFLSDHEKLVFLTGREINQHAVVKQAIQRQKWIDQAQSVNLFFAANSDPKYIHEVHLAAWQGGLKSLYYCRSEGVIKGDLASRSKDECTACEA